MSDKAQWLERVLGVRSGAMDTAARPAFDAATWLSARDAWNDAVSEMDRQISQLQAALRSSDDEELQQIAEYGLNSVTGRRRVALTVAILQVGDGAGAPNAIKAIRGMRSFLAEDEVIEACDRNPFGVAVSIRATLDPALQAMETALGA